MARLLRLVMLLSLCFPGAPDAADRAWTDVTVRVYDAALVPDADKARALAIAAAALAPAQLEVRFTHCGGASGKPACDRTLGADDVALRLVRRPLPQPRAGAPLPLGEALVDEQRRAGALATIHVERVEWLARESRADAAVLLGRTIAHELVHVLSGQGTHAPRGLMRGVWSRREIAQDRAEDWRLHEAETTLLRNRRRRADLQAAAR